MDGIKAIPWPDSDLGLRHAPALPDPAARERASASLALQRLYAGDLAGAREVLDHGGYPPEDSPGYLCLAWGVVDLHGANFDRARNLFARALDGQTAPRHRARALFFSGLGHLYQGELTQSDSDLTDALALYQGSGFLELLYLDAAHHYAYVSQAVFRGVGGVFLANLLPLVTPASEPPIGSSDERSVPVHLDALTGFHVTVNSRGVRIADDPLTRELLVYVVCHPAGASPQVLADTLLPDQPPSTAWRRILDAAFRLQQAFPPGDVDISLTHVGLTRAAAISTDLDLPTRLLDKAQNGTPIHTCLTRITNKRTLAPWAASAWGLTFRAQLAQNLVDAVILTAQVLNGSSKNQAAARALKSAVAFVGECLSCADLERLRLPLADTIRLLNHGPASGQSGLQGQRHTGYVSTRSVASTARRNPKLTPTRQHIARYAGLTPLPPKQPPALASV